MLLILTSVLAAAASYKAQMADGSSLPRIKEWHLHVYFLASNQEQVALADGLRTKIISAVAEHRFVAVCHGVGTSILPNLSAEDAARVPLFNTKPIGPHVSGSFEVWVPREYLSELLGWALPRRGKLTYLLHPLGEDELTAHTRDVAFFGTPYPLDTSVFDSSHAQTNMTKSEYPSLKLGYAAP